MSSTNSSETLDRIIKKQKESHKQQQIKQAEMRKLLIEAYRSYGSSLD